MKAIGRDFFGSARGPLTRAEPPARLFCGALFLAAVLTVPAGHHLAIAAVLTIATIAVLISGLPPRQLGGALLFGLLLYTPLVTILTLPTLAPLLADLLDAARSGPDEVRSLLASIGSEPALSRAGWILLKGVASLLVTLATVATLAARDVHPAISGLPLPSGMRLILIQIVQQTGMLLNETGRVRDAVALRGGGSGGGAARPLLAALPGAWLGRVASRAERVAGAMEVRGYVDAPLPGVHIPARWTRADVAMLGLGGGALTAVLVLRFTTT